MSDNSAGVSPRLKDAVVGGNVVAFAQFDNLCSPTWPVWELA